MDAAGEPFVVQGGVCGKDNAADSGQSLSSASSVTLPIPNVVQRALGTAYIAQFSTNSDNDDTIYGLESFSLPQYLSLRYKLPSRLDEGFRLALDEEVRDRQSRQNSTIAATQKKNKSKNKRKRKPKANASVNNEDDSCERKRKKRSVYVGVTTVPTTAMATAQVMILPSAPRSH